MYRRLVVSIAILLFAPALGAQPARPRLSAAADTNDWNAYYDYGAAQLIEKKGWGAAAFYWASRLAPDRAEPLFGRWVAFHMADRFRWQRYLDDDPRIRELPAVVAADSLQMRASWRNPFYSDALVVYLYDPTSDYWRRDDLTRGWLEAIQGHDERALRLLARGIEGATKRGPAWAHHTRATVFVRLRQYDSAGTEMRALASEIERGEARVTSREQQSHEDVYYAIGFVEAARGDQEAANEAMRQALIANLGFAPAHLFLGDQALRRHDSPAALAEYEQALQLDSTDAVLLHHHAIALAGTGRVADAIPSLRRAVALEPWYAEPWLTLGRALAHEGDRDGARTALERYVALAPRTATAEVAQARAVLAKLGDAGGR